MADKKQLVKKTEKLPNRVLEELEDYINSVELVKSECAESEDEEYLSEDCPKPEEDEA